MINILFILCLINTHFSFHAMEPSNKTLIKKVSFKKNNNATVKKSASFPSSLEKSTDINPFDRKKHPFFTALQNKDRKTINFYLSNPHFNPNPFNAPHELAALKDYDGIDILLKDPRIDFSQRDFEYKLVSDYIDRQDPNLSELRRKIFARITLDFITNNKCAKIKSIYDDNYLDEEYFTDIKKEIKKEIEDTYTKQGDTDLPPEAGFPDYADKEGFMDRKMWFILAIAQK